MKAKEYYVYEPTSPGRSRFIIAKKEISKSLDFNHLRSAPIRVIEYSALEELLKHISDLECKNAILAAQVNK